MKSAYLVILALLGGSSIASASAVLHGQREVFFVGFSITGQQSGDAAAAPTLSESVVSRPGAINDTVVARNKLLRAEIEARSPREFKLAPIEKQPMLDGTTSSIIVTAAIDRETVVTEVIDGKYKITVEIAAQALFFDGESKQVLGSVPVTVQYIDLLSTPPDEATKRRALLALLDKSGEYGLIAGMASAIASARIPKDARRFMQLIDASYAEGALDEYPTLKQKFRSGIVGLEFSKYFASRTGLALLPYRGETSQAIANALLVVFADGSQQALQVPAADYVIRINLDRLIKRTASQDSVAEQRLYGVFLTISVAQPLARTPYFNQQIRQGAYKTIPVAQVVVDDAQALYDTLLESFVAIGDASQGRATDWLAQQPGGRAARTEWNEFRKKIEECR